jgi:hypothetical protein
MLHGLGVNGDAIRSQFNYHPEDRLDPKTVRVYIAEETKMAIDGLKRKTTANTLVLAKIDSQYGIEARSFDTTINEMNSIQDAILYGQES